MPTRRPGARAAAIAVCAGMLLTATAAQARPAPPRGFAQPSDIVATEIAFARAVREKGRNAAFHTFAAPGGEIFGPEPVRVAAWTPAPAEARAPLTWSPTHIWMSCDGSYAYSTGDWQSGSAHGWFATVWQRQKKGEYRFVLDLGGLRTGPSADAGDIAASVAACPARNRAAARPALATVRDEIDAGRVADEETAADTRHRKPPRDPGPPDPNAADAAAALTADWLHGEARDHTLGWAVTTAADGTRRLAVRIKAGGAWSEVFAADLPAPPR